MNKLIEKSAGKGFFFVSLGVVGYVCFFILDYWYIYQYYEDITIIKFIVGFIREISIMPMLFIIQPGLFVFSIVRCIKEKFQLKSYSFYSFFILFIGNLSCLVMNLVTSLN